MNQNIFLKSMGRKPVHTLLLATLIMVATFALVSRVTEYIIVNQEINRIESSFNAIGILSPIDPQNITTDHDATHATQIIEASDLVAFGDHRVFTQGELDGFVNTTSLLRGADFSPTWEGLGELKATDHYFIGTMRLSTFTPRLIRGGFSNFLFVEIYVEQLIVGDFDALRDRPLEFTNRHGATAIIHNRASFMLPLTPIEASLYEEGLFDPFEGILFGQQYLFRAFPAFYTAEGVRWFLRPLVGYDALRGWNVDDNLRGDNLIFFADPAVLDLETTIERIQHNAYMASRNTTPPIITAGHDVTHAAQVIGESDLVAFGDERVFTQGVLYGITNTTSQLWGSDFVPPVEGLSDLPAMEHYFYGRMRIGPSTPRLIRGGFSNFIHVQIYVDELLVGDPYVIRDTALEFTNAAGATVVRSTLYTFRLPLTPEEADMYELGLFDPFGGIVEGERYLFRAMPAYYIPPPPQEEVLWYLRSLIGYDGFRGHNVDASLREDDLAFFLNPASADFEALFAQMQNDMDLARENIHSLMVIGTKDMSAMPRFQNPQSGRLLDSPLIDGGRWLTHEDYLNANPVVVITAQMAARRGLRVGDTLTITLQDNPRPRWIDTPGTGGQWDLGIENRWMPLPQGWWALTERHDGWQDRPTKELELTVVGVYWNTPIGIASHNFLGTEIYIPASLMPEGFGWSDSPLLTSMYSFVLDTPRDRQLFLDTYTEQLQALGFTPNFLPDGFDNFLVSAAPIRMSTTVNLIIFLLASAFIFVLVVFLHLKQYNKVLVISRALGTPAKLVLKRLFGATALVWMVFVVAGSLIAWFFAINQASSTLGTLDASEGVAGPNILWLVALIVALFIVLFAGLALAGYSKAGRPVLEQLQGTYQKPKKIKRKKSVRDDFVPENFTLGNIDALHKELATSSSAKTSASFRYILRHIFRSPIKTILLAVAALFSVLSLGWFDHTISTTEQEVGRLWNTTIVSGQLIQDREEERRLTGWGEVFNHAPITQGTLDLFMMTGFVEDVYLEALWNFSFIRSEEGMMRLAYLDDISHYNAEIIIGTNNLSGFIEENTRTPMDDAMGVLGRDVEVTFGEGFSYEDFAFVEGESNTIPALVSPRFLLEHGYEVGDYLWVSFPYMSVHVIGTFENGLNRGVGRFDESYHVVIMPLEALIYHGFSHGNPQGITYMTVRFQIKPERNREIEKLSEMIETHLAMNNLGFFGNIPLELMLNDQELRSTVEPLEQNLDLLRLLYPVIIATALILAMGLPLSSMQQNIKNAAIMRVLGKARAKSGLMLFIEQMLVCVIGIILGLAVSFTIGIDIFDGVPIVLAGLYFIGSLIGSLIGTFIINAKTPLESLQVKE